MISIRHREELHLIAVVIPTWVYAILWRSSFVYTSALIRKSYNHNQHGTHDYQSHSARPYKQRKTPTSEHSGVITLRTLILAPPRGDDIYISFSYFFCMFFFQSPPEFTTEPLFVFEGVGCLHTMHHTKTKMRLNKKMQFQACEVRKSGVY